jgi:hypothetical protein
MESSEALDGEVWQCLFGMVHGLLFGCLLLRAGSEMQAAAGGCELQAAMRDRHWSAESQTLLILGALAGWVAGVESRWTSWRYAGGGISNTGLAKVTTSYKALPCSHPVCASAVLCLRRTYALY